MGELLFAFGIKDLLMIRSGSGTITGSCRMFGSFLFLFLAALIAEKRVLAQGLPGQGPVVWTGNTTVVSTSRELVAALNSAANRTRSVVLVGSQGSEVRLY